MDVGFPSAYDLLLSTKVYIIYLNNAAKIPIPISTPIMIKTISKIRPPEKWFIDELEKAIKKNIIILNITQCPEGRVVQGMYATSSQLKKIGVIGGGDMTFEAAVTKLMFLLGKKINAEDVKSLLQKNLRGEMSN